MPQLGTIRKDGGGGIGDSRYFAGMMDNSGVSGRSTIFISAGLAAGFQDG